MRSKTDPVEFPALFVDFWLEKATEYQGEHPMPCDYCDEPIEKGEKFFFIHEFIGVSPKKRGHLSHLKAAPPREWAFDPAKQQPQPWEEDPSIPAPPGWEEWKRKNRGVNYG